MGREKSESDSARPFLSFLVKKNRLHTLIAQILAVDKERKGEKREKERKEKREEKREEKRVKRREEKREKKWRIKERERKKHQ